MRHTDIKQFYFRLSVSTDLKVDAERDLQDIGASKINVYPLNKVRSKAICIF